MEKKENRKDLQVTDLVPFTDEGQTKQRGGKLGYPNLSDERKPSYRQA